MKSGAGAVDVPTVLGELQKITVVDNQIRNAAEKNLEVLATRQGSIEPR